ncbi:integral membrane protein TerC [Shewanella sp. MR-4]|uniref:PGPGW domain-containing protein n=1 Tax=Shewanella sp. (strain MR-4) TaxID=60480 RepID=UPI00005E5A9A|nr:PGPGW domain-containing protein [Shewanella sp. MR-4]ABI39355.1 integral membrane protein TerC [Shewanella sp. MR-4]
MPISFKDNKLIFAHPAINRTVITVLGACFTLVGGIFLLLPGPGLLFILIGLTLLSTQYPWAKRWLRLSQRQLSKSAAWLDNQIRHYRR